MSSVLPDSSTLVCSVKHASSPPLAPCCKDTPKIWKNDWLYCEPKNDLNDFIKCLASGSNTEPSDWTFQTSCQRNVKSEVKVSEASGNSTSSGSDTKPNFGVKGVKTPGLMTVFVVALLTSFLLVAPASATTTGENSLARRQDSGDCKIDIAQTFNRTTSYVLGVSESFACSGNSFCTFDGRMDTGLNRYKRTLNHKDAAETEYDAFFATLGNTTTPKRLFPAVAGLSVYYEWAAEPGSTTNVAFTPIQVSQIRGWLCRQN